MKFCETHWAALRTAIATRGLAGYVAKNGHVAARQLAKQLQAGAESKETFDAVMSAHWAIVGNAFGLLKQAGADPAYLLNELTPEDPIDVAQAGEQFAGRTWPRCPVCCLNVAHEVTCTNPRCSIDRKLGYDWMIDRAADDSLAQAREYGLIA